MFVTLWFINLIVWCTAQKQNFLLIIVDDLRTALGCYGDAKAYTPNIDRLATGAAIFSQAFAQQALCAPSRNSFLTSRRPDTLHLYDFYSYWRKDIGNFTTLPQHLKNNGYITKSVGKVFHPENHPLHKFEVPEPYKWSKNVSSIAYNPWNDLRKREDIAALNLKFPWEKIPKSFARLIIQSYYASVTYIDDLIGTLINHLERLSIRGDTTIILMSDHGWSLGEHAVWAKYSNYDVALKVPLIVSIPGLTYEKLKENTSVNNSSKGNQIFIDSIVELVDIFPTIADLANISIPICSSESMQITCSEGITFIPLIRAALKDEPILWKKAAFAQYPRPSIEPSIHPNSDEPRLKEIKAMGYTLRTNKYRYIAWLSFNPETMSPNWNNIIAEELYDYSYDKGENQNVAFLEEYAKLKEKLKILLQHGWRNILSDKSNF
ncbi:iduronate 2-sulfatase isoform X3 [Bombus affinis]|uniref:iduronate 2-sulfatase isoform X3 n=1 Tax=Bombus affinis TaxID=309941 RepID=UPI0021B8312A|nr:iduronate 2-sulfatase isoform X3 [Bombus affinis]